MSISLQPFFHPGPQILTYHSLAFNLKYLTGHLSGELIQRGIIWRRAGRSFLGEFSLSARMFPKALLGQQVVQVTIIYLATCLWSCLRPRRIRSASRGTTHCSLPRAGHELLVVHRLYGGFPNPADAYE